MATATESNALECNLHVDYVIRYSFSDVGECSSSPVGQAPLTPSSPDQSQAVAQLEKLLRTLSQVGLQTEVRQGDESSLLVFVRASNKRLQRAIYRSRVRDWLYGIRNAEPEPASSVEAQTEAERLRVISHMITHPKEEGGAEITPNHGEWKNVTAIFALHDRETNKKWMRDWSQKTFLSDEDLDDIRNKFGESVGFYFSFLQSYFRFLIFPAVFGFSCWFLLGGYSIVYALVNGLWCIIFVEYWKRQEVDLGCRWQTKGVSAVQTKRRKFRPDKEVRDDSTGEVRGVFPTTKRIQRQLLQAPFALLAAIALGAIIATCFAIEIFISELYNGPFKSYLVFIPTILVSALVPTMSAVLTTIATKLNDYENHETDDAYDVALTQKIFVINFMTSYLPIILTAFVYVPFASLIVPYLDVFRLTVRPFVSKESANATKSHFQIDPARLRNQVIYFTVTAQIVGFAMETIVPYLKQHALREYKNFSKRKNSKSTPGKGNGDKESPERQPAITYDDPAEEVQFLKRVRNEAELPEYDTTDDLREMCIQFGYLALFSPVWPLVPLSFFVNNWIELRSDFFKICMEFQRPTPMRSDTIGPWLDSLAFLSWVGSITSAALVYMFSGNSQHGPNGEPTDITGWALLLTIFFSEHLYLIVRYAVQMAMTKLEPPNARKERAERYLMRKRYLESTLRAETDEVQGEDDVDTLSPETSRAALEEDARRASLHGSDPAERFWMRQHGWMESAKVGAGMIQAPPAKEGIKKEQ
ncbi:Acyl-CoA N-acyltransferase [Penicillium riverlandense]|uniref:Acyl-CoA N-acyltransferase n=1 Tax=Penicillium riverlandense TaxID=1903569 RepID=UPI00254932F3|nr:Acyl-CoA N-acyltransferase [Penicillium riverlandense]KAJ5833934.1 Acyl-CoA N-acyltransferase [Penicillium riverlandense]